MINSLIALQSRLNRKKTRNNPIAASITSEPNISCTLHSVSFRSTTVLAGSPMPGEGLWIAFGWQMPPRRVTCSKLHPRQRQPGKDGCYVDDLLRLGLSDSNAKKARSFVATRKLSRRYAKLILFHFSGAACEPFTILDVSEFPSKQTQSYHGAEEGNQPEQSLTHVVF